MRSGSLRHISRRSPLALTLAATFAVSATAAGCRSAAKVKVAEALTAANREEDFRRQVPPSGPPPQLHLPKAQEKLLSNGLQVVLSPRPGRPLATARLVVRSGSAEDPPQQEGLALFVGEMLRHGTQKRTAEQIAQEIEDLGTSIEGDVNDDLLTLSVTALAENFDKAFDIFADVALHPDFLPKEIEWLRKQRLGNLDEAEGQAGYVATRTFRRALYGSHPYGHPTLGSRASVAKLGRDDMLAFYGRHFQPGNAALVLAGDLTLEQAEKLAERGFGLWAGRAKGLPAPPVPRAGPPQVLLVDRPGATQSALVVGALGTVRKDTDHEALAVLNTILGGSFNSRINMNLREDKAYTYGAYSRFPAARARGTFEVHTRVRTDVTAAALREIFAEVSRIGASDVSEEELGDAKRMLVRSLPGMFQSIEDVAGQFGSLWAHDLPLDELNRFRERVAKVTAGDVRRLAQQYLDPASLVVSVVGDAAAVRADLEALQRGAVVLVAADEPTVSKPAPKSAAGR